MAVFHLRIYAADPDRHGDVTKLHVGALSDADPGEVELINLRRELETGVRGYLRKALAALAVLPDLQIEVRETSRHRGTDDQVVELAADDTQILLELVQLIADLGSSPRPPLVLFRGALLDDGAQGVVVTQLVGSILPLRNRGGAPAGKRIAPLREPAQAYEVVLDFGQGSQVRLPILLE